MDTLRKMAYAMLEQAATVHQMMNQLGRQLEGGRGGNPNGPEVNLEYLNLQNFEKRTRLVSEEPLIETKMKNGSRQWKKSFQFWIALIIRSCLLPTC